MKGEKGRSDRSNCFKLQGASPMNTGIGEVCGLVGSCFRSTGSSPGQGGCVIQKSMVIHNSVGSEHGQEWFHGHAVLVLGRNCLQGNGVRGQGGMASNRQQAELDEILGRISSMREWWGTRMGLSREAVAVHPCKCSRPSWLGLSTTWSSARCPCPWQKVWN